MLFISLSSVLDIVFVCHHYYYYYFIFVLANILCMVEVELALVLVDGSQCCLFTVCHGKIINGKINKIYNCVCVDSSIFFCSCQVTIVKFFFVLPTVMLQCVDEGKCRRNGHECWHNSIEKVRKNIRTTFTRNEKLRRLNEKTVHLW